MKNVFSILLALLYLGTTNGFALQVHYCMDKISGLSLGDTEQKDCGKCGMKKGGEACCKDELKFVKLNETHKLQVDNYQLQPPVIDITTIHVLLAVVPVVESKTIRVHSHAPPDDSPVSRNIRYCVFRI